MSFLGIDLDRIDFLGVSNPFATPVGQKIEEATDSSLPSEDWAKNIEVCDLINAKEDGPKDAIRAIKKRLQQNAGRNNNAVLLTLTLLETCVKNCDRRFHVLVCSKDFVQELIKVIGPKNDPPVAVQEKILSLIQTWADAFRNQPDTKGVVEVYNELIAKGIEFPPMDLDAMVPITTPKRTVQTVTPPSKPSPVSPVRQMPEPSATPGPVTLSVEAAAKLRKELDAVEANITVFSDMLQSLEPGKESAEDWELMQGLYGTCRQMQRRLIGLVNRVANEDLTGVLLKLNDDLNNIFLRFGRYDKKRAAVVGNPLESQKPATKPSSDVNLIDFGEETAPQKDISERLRQLDLVSPSTSQLKNINGIPASTGETTDEFATLAKSRATIESPKREATSAYKDNLEPDHLNVSLGAAAQLRDQPERIRLLIPSDEDAKEIETWLGKEEGTGASQVSSEMTAYMHSRSSNSDFVPGKLPNQPDENAGL
ncbi:TOM1-like protein 2 isoform X1 [Artemia franciscana]|uniref:TOM1-like protein 2 isoform X1 n=1 Tax=Artemia franciscana TaxID=6661 RepID=UPI0032DBD921